MRSAWNHWETCCTVFGAHTESNAFVLRKVISDLDHHRVTSTNLGVYATNGEPDDADENQGMLFLVSARRATSIQYSTPMVSASSLKS